MEVNDVLKQCKIDGKVVTLPDTQLDRKLYLNVAKKLELIGGKWNRKYKGFLFEQDPSELFADILNGNNRNLKKEYQFFETPEDIAERLVELAEPYYDDKVLEPSAGRGAIVRAINEYNPDIEVYACEIFDLNRKLFKGTCTWVGSDFFDIIEIYDFDCVIANPPFSKNQDIDHIYKMFEVCKSGGRIVTVASKHWELSSNKKETTFREWLYDLNATIIELERGDFKSSGTEIQANIIIIDKP